MEKNFAKYRAGKTKIYDSLQIERPKVKFDKSKELVDELARNYDTLPLLGTALYEYNYKRHYSLKTNELLQRRWDLLKKNYIGKEPPQYIFPSPRDLHFRNGRVRYAPHLTLTNQKNHRKHLKVGPDVDDYGLVPVPNELLLRKPSAKGVRKQSAKRNTPKKQPEAGQHKRKVKER